jgi:Domain of unknown function (DUF4198)
MRRLIWLACALPCVAHDLYLMPARFLAQRGQPLEFAFQNGDEFPVAFAPVKLERLRDTELRSRAGRAPFENLVAGEKNTTGRVMVPGNGVAILTARTITNLIEMTPPEFREYLEHENLSDVVKWREANGQSAKPGRERYSKYVKALILSGKPDSYYRERTGLTIEIIPEANPYALQLGQMLPVQVLFRGKPAAGVAVESAWLENGKATLAVVGRTDAQGRVTVPVKAAGPHRLHAIVMERCAEPQAADWESFWASLTFEIQPR